MNFENAMFCYDLLPNFTILGEVLSERLSKAFVGFAISRYHFPCLLTPDPYSCNVCTLYRRTTRSTVSGSRWSTETTSSCASWRRTTRAAENAASPPYCTWWRCRSSPAAPSAVSTRSTRYRLLNSVTCTLVILHSHVDYNLSLKLGKTLQKSLFTAYLLCGHLLLAARTFGMAFLINTRLH